MRIEWRKLWRPFLLGVSLAVSDPSGCATVSGHAVADSQPDYLSFSVPARLSIADMRHWEWVYSPVSGRGPAAPG